MPADCCCCCYALIHSTCRRVCSSCQRVSSRLRCARECDGALLVRRRIAAHRSDCVSEMARTQPSLTSTVHGLRLVRLDLSLQLIPHHSPSSLSFRCLSVRHEQRVSAIKHQVREGEERRSAALLLPDRDADRTWVTQALLSACSLHPQFVIGRPVQSRTAWTRTT